MEYQNYIKIPTLFISKIKKRLVEWQKASILQWRTKYELACALVQSVAKIQSET